MGTSVLGGSNHMQRKPNLGVALVETGLVAASVLVGAIDKPIWFVGMIAAVHAVYYVRLRPQTLADIRERNGMPGLLAVLGLGFGLIIVGHALGWALGWAIASQTF